MSTSPLVKGSTPSMVAIPTIKKRNPSIEDFKFRSGLPTAAELPDSDDRPVDSELQELIPGLLKAILFYLWPNRTDEQEKAKLSKSSVPFLIEGIMCSIAKGLGEKLSWLQQYSQQLVALSMTNLLSPAVTLAI